MSLTDHERAVATDALNQWVTGNQAAAVDLVRPDADAGEPYALALIAWFFSQMGEPAWREGVPYAERAIRLGMTWLASNYLSPLLNDQQIRHQIPAVLAPALERGWQFDPIAHAIGPFQNNDRATAMDLIALNSAPTPLSPEAWRDLLSRAEANFTSLRGAAGDIEQQRVAAAAAIQSDVDAVQQTRVALETQTQQLQKLLEQIKNAEVQSFFDTEATSNTAEAKDLWKWAIRLLAAAAIFAVLPVVIHFLGVVFGKGWLSDQNLVAAHFAPAVALGAVSGVILARARARDRVGQRARDLSIALGTMIAYAGEIPDEEQRRVFLHDMARAVIEAFLRQESSRSEADGSGLLAALLRRS